METIRFSYRFADNLANNSIIRGADNAHDMQQLILVVPTAEQGDTSDHLCEDAPTRPDVDRGAVRAGTEEYVRRTIPERHHLFCTIKLCLRRRASGTYLVRECVHRHAESPSQTEISQLQLSFTIDQEILRFQVSVQYAILVAERCTLQELVHEAAYGVGIQSSAIAMCVHVLLQIPLAVFEDEDQLGLCMNHVVEADDVDVFKFLHERDFTDGGRRGALFRIEMYLLEGDNFVRCPGTTLQPRRQRAM